MRTAMLAIFFCLVWTVATAGSGARPAPGVRGATFAARPLRAGDAIAGRIFENDRIEWKLPEKRLERFRAAGAIITEEHHITSVVAASVVAADPSGSVVHVTAHVTSYDVPRATTTVSDQTYTAHLRPDNEPAPGRDQDVAEAALVGLPIWPGAPGHIGRRWRTRVPVTTALGSGSVTFDHELVGVENGLVEIAVSGSGTITGAQYHLPKLLPGSIQVRGTAWYDPSAGIVTQESYFIRNRLIKPAEGEQIGFDERLSVDASSRLSKAAP